MKVLLIRPDFTDPRYALKNFGLRHLPLGLLYLATVLKARGHEPVIFDESVEDGGGEAAIERTRPDLVGITVPTPLAGRAAGIASHAKEKGFRVVIGGPHVSAFPRSVLDVIPADIAVAGEGEDTLPEIADGVALEEIRGIAYRSGDQVLETASRDLQMNLDSIPIPDRSLVNLELYRGDVEYGIPLERGERIFRLIASRGCKFECTFCARHTTFGRIPRFRSAGNVLEEIGLCIRQYGARKLIFMDDTFTADEAFVQELCEGIMREKMDVRWGCITRVDVPASLMELMRKAGCILLEMGVESGSERVLKSIKKGISVPQAVKAFKTAHALGIKTKVFFIVGFPGETEEDLEESIKAAKAIGADYLWAAMYTPLPGSDLYEAAPEPDLGEDNFFFSRDPEKMRRFRRFLLKYFLRPAIIPIVLRNFKEYMAMAGRLKMLR
jgi:radical SAM superfamily enzyme YgiQ (UPF0313 family)